MKMVIVSILDTAAQAYGRPAYVASERRPCHRVLNCGVWMTTNQTHQFCESQLSTV